MSRKSWLISISLILTFTLFIQNQSRADLSDGFRDPPSCARPAVYWVWVNGLSDRQQMTYELEQYKAKGVRRVYIFDVGARDPQKIVPAGPAFMGPESLKAIGFAVREAARLGIEVGLVTSSSWNCGGPWIKPEYASMGLFHHAQTVEGPLKFSEILPFPNVSKRTPKGPDGLPLYYKNVAVLATPEAKRLAGHEFVFELSPPGIHSIDKLVLTNTLSGDEEQYGSMHLFTKDFMVLASTTNTEPEAFKEILRETLKPNTESQTFRFEPVQAKYIKLIIFSGYNKKDDKIQLGEFEVYSTQGTNVVGAYHADGSKTAANLLHYSSALGLDREWTAANIHDGNTSGAEGSWCSAGAPRPVIEDIDSIVDVTEHVNKEGRLTWDVPPGKWTIMRFICANTGAKLVLPSPKSEGLAMDHFNAEATRMHFNYMIDLLEKELGNLKETALKHTYVCSYELSGSTWTPDLLQQFEQRRGYDMTPYLPVLLGSVVCDHETTERFRYDFRKTLGDLLVDAFYKPAREISNEHGLLLCAEAGGPGPPLHQVPVDALKALGALDIPRGEFWKEHNVWVVKETACAAHIYGKKVVDMEAFTSWRHWQDGPFDLKPIADRAMCGGTNHFSFHTSAHNPPDAGLPGWVYHAGTHINPSLAWWPKAGAFIDYLSRCSYLLQEGLFVADVCYYYGDQGFNFVPPKHVDPSLGYGYDYDVTNAEGILTRMSVQNGRLVLPDGMSYEVLVLPDREDMDLEVLRKVEKLVENGATVVGRKPTKANGLTGYPLRDDKVKELADALWGPCDGQTVKEHQYGKGTIIWGRSLREILQGRDIGPDFGFISVNGEEADLDFIHRKTSEADVYFVSNKNMQWQDVECTFRVVDKIPELWDPTSGTMRPLGVYRSGEGGTHVPLRLAPAGSVFVVFRKDAPGNHLVSVTRDNSPIIPNSDIEILPGDSGDLELRVFRTGSYVLKTARGNQKKARVNIIPPTVEIKGPWDVRFPEGWGAPAVKTFPELISWTEDADEGVKYFSGIATYHKEFELSARQLRNKAVYLDLGRVRFVADVSLNGKHLGILWKPPFRIEITNAAKAGKNKLVVEVANTWSNRLVGDANSPEDQRYCRTNMTRSLTWEKPWKETPLLESGLLGPVQLVTAKKRNIKLPK
ncbi:MAG: hypothetical protein JXM79_22565 [Sedimentisphaerales bacterium]|nr:hypothetical protein [Sedimentisphaerales bacterium]